MRFDLLSVLNDLGKDPEFIAYSVTYRRHLQGGKGVQKTCGQSTKPSISQPGFRFVLQKGIPIFSCFLGTFTHFFINPQINQIIRKLRSN